MWVGKKYTEVVDDVRLGPLRPVRTRGGRGLRSRCVEQEVVDLLEGREDPLGKGMDSEEGTEVEWEEG